MAVTLEQMASAYVQSVEQEIERAKDIIRQNQEYLAGLENHLEECKNQIADRESTVELPVEAPTAPPSDPMEGAKVVKVEDLGDGKTRETIQLPNPFEQLTQK